MLEQNTLRRTEAYGYHENPVRRRNKLVDRIQYLGTTREWFISAPSAGISLKNFPLVLDQ